MVTQNLSRIYYLLSLLRGGLWFLCQKQIHIKYDRKVIQILPLKILHSVTYKDVENSILKFGSVAIPAII